MKITWLHISDFHIRAGDPYDRNVVLRALVSSVEGFRRQGRSPDLIFATGDIAHSGKAAEYELATAFFDALLDAAGLERRHLFVIPGNHDVDRDLGVGLARTLTSREEADAYFNPKVPKVHLTQKLGELLRWHDQYFKGIRELPRTSTCGPVEAVEVRGCKIAVLPVNSALFCQDDSDHANLLIGRRCLDSALEELRALDAHLRIALIHHPLDWLSDVERSNIKADLQANVDVILRGHLHETEVESVVSAQGGALHVAAGAAYQTRKWPNRALYATFEDRGLTIFPIRYEDQPREVWTVDPSLFPHDPNYERRFPVPRLTAVEPEKSAAPVKPTEPSALPRFRSNITSRHDRPFVGREEILTEIQSRLGNPVGERILILHGPPGVGKSELAREYARRQRNLYPGGMFFIDAGSGDVLVDLARIGNNFLDLDFPPDLPLKDQCERTLLSLGTTAVLLIYDNVSSAKAIEPWLPPAGMPCHVLITTVVDRWDGGWSNLEVKPLSHESSLSLIEQVAGREVGDRYGEPLAKLAGGLPMQIVPAAATLAYEARRGRLESFQLTMTEEARESFRLVYERLESPVRLLLHAAAFLNGQRILRPELYRELSEACGWSEPEFQKQLDVCLDLHLLDGDAELRMHQLFSSFLRATSISPESASTLEKIRNVQKDRFVALAEALAYHPAEIGLAEALMMFPLRPEDWTREGQEVPIAGGAEIGFALLEIGKPQEALPWYERAVEIRRQAGEHGRIDHTVLGKSLYQVGACLTRQGKHMEALPYYERAVEAHQKGDVSGRIDNTELGKSLYHVGFCLLSQKKYRDAISWGERSIEACQKGNMQGRIDHVELGRGLHLVGVCLSRQNEYKESLPWYERAVDAYQKGDVHGRVDHTGLGISLHQVGYSLSSQGKSEEALAWYERAAEIYQKGDVYGRINHDFLGRSLHWVGHCLSDQGKCEEALPWYERAVEALRQGDIFGRIDNQSLANSLKSGANCLRNLRRLEEAKAWEAEATRLESQI